MTLSKQLTLRLPADLKRELNDYAKATGQSRSAVVREAIAIYGPRQGDERGEPATLDVGNNQ
jgi:predicted transcriptional regulator